MLFSSAGRIAEQINDIRGLAFALKGMGEIDAALKKYKNSIQHINLSIALFKSIKYKTGIAYAIKSLGDAYFLMGEIGAAHSAYEEAEEIFAKGRDQRGSAYVNKSLGDIYMHLGIIEKAYVYYLKANDFFYSKNILYGLNMTSNALNNAKYMGLRHDH
jgi:tetratricopeptide (TPR) repeat protein